MTLEMVIHADHPRLYDAETGADVTHRVLSVVWLAPATVEARLYTAGGPKIQDGALVTETAEVVRITMRETWVK